MQQPILFFLVFIVLAFGIRVLVNWYKNKNF